MPKIKNITYKKKKLKILPGVVFQTPLDTYPWPDEKKALIINSFCSVLILPKQTIFLIIIKKMLQRYYYHNYFVLYEEFDPERKNFISTKRESLFPKKIINYGNTKRNMKCRSICYNNFNKEIYIFLIRFYPLFLRQKEFIPAESCFPFLILAH